jgi:hypothetical protein
MPRIYTGGFMPIYEVEWTKLYHKSGTFEVEADNEDAAHDMARDMAQEESDDMPYYEIEPTMDDIEITINECEVEQ